MNFFNKKNLSSNKNQVSDKKVRKGSDIAKLEEKINQEKLEIKESLNEIGRIYYELYRNDSHEKLVPICNLIDESYRIVGLCEKQTFLLQGIQVCPNCQARVSLDSLFCNRCGTKIDALEDDDGSMSSENEGADNKLVKCRECGTSMPGDMVFCTNCGAKIK